MSTRKSTALVLIPVVLATSLATMLAACAPAGPPSADTASPVATPATIPSPAATPGGSTAPATPPPASPGPTFPPVTPSTLLEVLTLVGTADDTIAFTDWTALKRSTGSEAVTGASAFEAKVAALGTEYAASDAWLDAARTHREDWGFDAFDLAWEATATTATGTLHVLRFADPAVPLAFLARLDVLGYAAEQLPHGTLRAGSLADLLGKVTPSLSLVTAAVLDDGLTVVASSNADLVRAVLTNGPITPESDAAVQAAALLVEPTTAVLLADDPCTAITDAVLATKQAGDGPSVADQLATAGTLGHPDAVAVAYATGAAITGRVVMTYADAAVAKADLEPRGILARAGTGIGRPLAEVQTVVDARLDGSSIVFDLEPPAGEEATKGFARRLMGAVIARDMVYAACTP